MADLRDLLTGLGYDDVSTHLQSGNVILQTGRGAARVRSEAEKAIAERFGFEVDVIVRTQAQLARIVETDPLADVADDPAKYAVAFLSEKPKAAAVREVSAELGPEHVRARGREVYVWAPDGMRERGVMKALASGGLAPVVTVRNWKTVRALAEKAADPGAAKSAQ